MRNRKDVVLLKRGDGTETRTMLREVSLTKNEAGGFDIEALFVERDSGKPVKLRTSAATAADCGPAFERCIEQGIIETSE